MGHHLDLPGCRRAGRSSQPSLCLSGGAEFQSGLAQHKELRCSGECTNRCWGVISAPFMKMSSTWKILGEVNNYEGDIIYIFCKEFSKKPLKNIYKSFL